MIRAIVKTAAPLGLKLPNWDVLIKPNVICHVIHFTRKHLSIIFYIRFFDMFLFLAHSSRETHNSQLEEKK